MRKWLRRWLLGPPDQKLVDTFEEIREVHNVLERSAPVMQAYRIANGYIVHVVDRSEYLQGKRIELPTYCKDHQAIADFLVTKFAVEKLLGQQLELPLNQPSAAGQPIY